MKPLPKGNYALAIAHPGHELRLHAFMEEAKPFVFILTDGSQRTGMDLMHESIKCIDKATKHGIKVNLADIKNPYLNKIFKYGFPENPPDQIHLKDLQIYEEIMEQRTDFFISFIDFMATNLIKYKIDYLVADPSEGTNVVHEMVRIMSDIAVRIVKKKTSKEIILFDYSLDTPFNQNLNDDCMHIQLDHDAIERKLDAIQKFPLATMDLKPNISMDANLVMEFSKMPDGKNHIRQLLKDMGADFLGNEYIRPYYFSEHSEKPAYEVSGEKAVKAEKYFQVITYENHIKPLKEKIYNILFANAN